MEYMVEKDGIRFYVQPEMIEAYSLLGYTIIKLERVVVTDVKKEAELVKAEIEKEQEEKNKKYFNLSK